MPEVSIEIVEGHGAGRQLSVDTAIDIGREPGIGIVLSDPLVSRRHARLTPAEGGAIIEDLLSSNGTVVNGQPIFEPTPVAAGDSILLGTTVIQVRSAEQVAHQVSVVQPTPPALAARRSPPPASVASHELDALLDRNVKHKARTAPLAIFILVVFVILIYLAQR